MIYKVNDYLLSDIGDALRKRFGFERKVLLSEMPDIILSENGGSYEGQTTFLGWDGL